MTTSNKIEVCRVKVYVRVEDLKIHPLNPRKISSERLEQLKQSILKKGFYEPILVWKKGGVVLSGNHRLQAAKELIAEGFEFVAPDGKKNVLPVVIEDVSYKVAESILFEANNHYAEWVDEKLKTAIREAQEHGSDVSDFGFTQKELDRMLKVASDDAEDVLKITNQEIDRELGPKFLEPEKADPPTLEQFAIDEEEYSYLTLPKTQIDQMRNILVIIAKAIDPKWENGSLSDAADVLVKAINASGILDSIKGNSDGKKGHQRD